MKWTPGLFYTLPLPGIGIKRQSQNKKKIKLNLQITVLKSSKKYKLCQVNGHQNV